MKNPRIGRGRASVPSTSAGTHRGLRSRLLRGTTAISALSLIAAGFGAAVTAAAPANAATPPAPFPVNQSLAFIAQSDPTQLYQAATVAGEVQFDAIGGTGTGLEYNALAYDTGDNFLYALVFNNHGNAGYPNGSVIQIDRDGDITRVGTSAYPNPAQPWNAATFDPDNGYLYVTNSISAQLLVIDPSTGARVTSGVPAALSTAPLSSDLSYADGALWGVTDNGTTIVRVDPASGTVSTFPSPLPTGVYGAVWTYGNGNLAFADNSGTLYQVAVSGGTTPSFTVVASQQAPPTGNNDGAGSPGELVDLAIAKTADPAVLVPGGSVSYSLKVTNNGPGVSSGYVVTDAVPSPLTGVASADPACTVTGNDVTCVGGELGVGQSATFVITADVPAAGANGPVSNTASVLGNEADPVTGNNEATAAIAPGVPALTLVKHAAAPTDVDGDGLTDVGDTIQYTFTVSNTGTAAAAAVKVTDAKVGSVTCPQTTLAAGADMSCAADSLYVITPADVAAGAVNNSATATGTGPDGSQIDSVPSTTSTPTTAPDPELSLAKSADRTELVAGQTVTYTFAVTNTGNVPLNDVTVDEGDFSGTGTLSSTTCPEATLAPRAEEDCTASYVVTQADVDAGTLSNTATASGTTFGGEPVVSAPASVAIPQTPAPGLTIAKAADKQQITQAGQVVHYTFVVTNTGNVTLHDVKVNETSFNGHGTLPNVVCPSQAASLAPGTAVTCGVDYVVVAADVVADGTLENAANASGTTPGGDPVVSVPSEAKVIEIAVPQATPPRESLAQTGSDIDGPFGIAALALGLGLIVLIVARLRRRRIN